MFQVGRTSLNSVVNRVQVQIKRVRDATCYLVNLIEHRAVDGTVDSHWGIDVTKISTAVNLHYADPKNVQYCG